MGITQEQLGLALLSLKNYIDSKGTSAGHEVWLNDYKTFGENSYVFNDKDIWNELLNDYELCMNDININGICLDHASENNQVGVAISYIYGIDTTQWQSIATINDLLNDTTFINTIFTADNISKYMVLVMSFLKSTNSFEIISTNSTAMDCIMRNEAIVNLIIKDDLIMNSIINNEDALMYMISTQASLEVLYENHELASSYLVKSSYLLYKAAVKAEEADRITLWLDHCLFSNFDDRVEEINNNISNKDFRCDRRVFGPSDRVLWIYATYGQSSRNTDFPDENFFIIDTMEGVVEIAKDSRTQPIGKFTNKHMYIHPHYSCYAKDPIDEFDNDFHYSEMYFINLDKLHN